MQAFMKLFTKIDTTRKIVLRIVSVFMWTIFTEVIRYWERFSLALLILVHERKQDFVGIEQQLCISCLLQNIVNNLSQFSSH